MWEVGGYYRGPAHFCNLSPLNQVLLCVFVFVFVVICFSIQRYAVRGKVNSLRIAVSYSLRGKQY